MKLKDFFLILLVVAIWGFNFVFVSIGLRGLPPIFFCALRFFLASVPLIFFVKRPPCSWRLLFVYGFVLFTLQFCFLFSGMYLGMSPGLASLIMQVHVFFTIALATVFFKERPTRWQIIGACISFLGILYVAIHTGGDVTMIGLVFTILASLSWGVGNIISKKIGKVPSFPLVIWGSMVAWPCLMLFSLVFEGPTQISNSLINLNFTSIFAVLYNVLGSTYISYSLWNRLLNQYSASTVAPFTLLVPVFGFIGSAIFIGEVFPAWKVVSALLVVFGLCFNLLGPKFKYYFSRS